MENKKVMNRGWVVLGAILIQLALGAIYAWSVFTPGLTATSPKEVVDVYGVPTMQTAPQLDIDKDQFDSMNEDLKDLRAELYELEARIKGAEDAETEKLLKQEKENLLAKINTIIRNYVPEETLNKLSFGFSKTKTQVVFALGLAFFAIVMVFAGKKLKTWGPKKLSIIGGIVLGLGYFLAGVVGDTNFWTYAVFIGIIGGSGIGLGYVVPIAVGMRWFPDKKGMITGLAVAGFGFGAMGWIKIAGSWGNLIANTGLSTTFMIYGVVFALMVIIGGLWMVFPPEGWKPKNYVPPEVKDAAGKAIGEINFTSGEMLKTPQFYMIFLTFVFSAGAGLMSIGLMKLYPIEALMDSGISAIQASAIAGTAMAIFFSLANGLGRILWGLISDKLGRKNSILLMTATQGILVILFTFMAGNEIWLYVGATLIGFNFGGNFALFPTITADTFGAKNVGQNYPFVFLAYGVGGILGPILGGALGDVGNFALAFTITGVAVLIGTLLTAFVKPLTKTA
ncbi:MAG: MFS transporter [Bacteroidales bacterium]